MKAQSAWLLLAVIALSACKVSVKASTAEDSAGTTMRGYGCTSCHNIPGIAGAESYVGPPLDHFGRRSYIAGTLPNTVQNLSFWIQHPQTVHPGTAMPEMHVTPQDGDAMARYLETLH